MIQGSKSIPTWIQKGYDMAYTRHGHHVIGTIKDMPQPHTRARCGGPRLCPDCSQDAAFALGEVDKKVHLVESRENRVTVCTGEPYEAPHIPEGSRVVLCTVCHRESLNRGGSGVILND